MEEQENKYNYYHGEKSKLDEWISKHQDIFNRCTFDTSWAWHGKLFISCFKVHLMAEPINNEHNIKSNERFFEVFAAEKEIGYFQGELMHNILDIIKKENVEYSSSSLGVKDGFFVFGTYGNIKRITKIAELFNENFKLFYKINKVGKEDYDIYLHKNKSKINELKFEEPAIIEKEFIKKDKSNLLKEKAKLEKKLKEIEELL